MDGLKQRAINVLLGLDEGVNSLFGGQPQESVSGTVGRALLQPKPPVWAKAASVALDGVFGSGHCQNAAAIEQARRNALASLPSSDR